MNGNSLVTEETAKFPELTPQSETEQRPHKVSFYVDKVKAKRIIEALSQSLEKRGLDVKIIYSGGTALDVLPHGAGKGQALIYLLKKLQDQGKKPINTLVCGDSGNDAELFSVPQVYGVMVSNAQEELLQWHEENAKNNPKIVHPSKRCAGAIVEAIGIFNLGPNISPRDVSDFRVGEEGASNPSLEVVKYYLLYERWKRAEIPKSEPPIPILKSLAVSYGQGVSVHPSGHEKPLHQYVDGFGTYGEMQGREFRVWLDRVSSGQLVGTDTDAWLVKFDQWEVSGKICLRTNPLQPWMAGPLRGWRGTIPDVFHVFTSFTGVIYY